MNAQLTFVANLKGKGENCWPTEQTCLVCVSLSYRIVKPFSIKTTKSDPFGQDIGLTWNLPPTVTLRRIPSSTSNPKKILMSTFRFSVKWIQTQAVLPSVCHSNHWATDRSLDYFPQNKLVIFGDFFKGTFNNHPSDRITVCLSPAHIYCKDTSVGAETSTLSILTNCTNLLPPWNHFSHLLLLRVLFSVSWVDFRLKTDKSYIWKRTKEWKLSFFGLD